MFKKTVTIQQGYFQRKNCRKSIIISFLIAMRLRIFFYNKVKYFFCFLAGITDV